MPSYDPIVWQDSYSVGVPVLDVQHKALIALINKLSEQGGTAGMMGYVFDELEVYVRTHFKTEEELMAAYAYPDLDAHRRQHRAFEHWLRAVRQTYDSGTHADLIAESVNTFLRHWLINHILSADRAYKPLLGARPET